MTGSPYLQLKGIAKRFGSTQALKSVHLDVARGEVHALMGENGAGKSTLMKILAGNIQRDAGDIILDGHAVEISSPRAAKALGIAIIHQELNTIPDMTVGDNLALGQEPRTRFGTLDRRRVQESARTKLARIGARVDPRMRIGDLSIGMQQMVEIARAVAEDAGVLVLDEPTAALSQGEADELYRLINQMRAAGVALIYISHRMEEVWKLADRITVLRDGAHVGTGTMAELNPDAVVRMMVGRSMGDLYDHPVRTPGDEVLRVEGLVGNGVGPVDLAVRAGEVVGLAGLIGAGRTELARLIFGADARTAGRVSVEGRQSAPRSPVDAIADGLGMLPEDRKSQGLFPDHSVESNVVISSLRAFSTLGVVDRAASRNAVRSQMQRLSLRASAIDLPVGALSGGNQQKAALARWLLRDARVLILDEPTRGVDIGTKREIYRLIDGLARSGKAVLIVSSDLPEVIGITDRVLVMRRGRIVRNLSSADTGEEEVMAYATGTNLTADAPVHGALA
ncbi:sugar ABC transporter ATP-binding protein [Acidisoma sp. S159]|uniref:sugar ABC transporter ATP-binding protein n=1 Tax=Acidisoma sp. S159 TaxID=1747225 RepID=UPI00131B4A85|nr:sugar ABC transporter ATP-binding protein [Acidisoma sp. S159]